MSKTKKIFLILFLAFLISFGFHAGKSFADNCSSANPGFSCIDKAQSSDASKCVKNLCPGAANIQCCPSAQASAGGVSGNVVSFTNPLQYNSVEGFLGGILTALQRIIVVLALVFIVAGAIMILASAGSPDMVERGKKAITMAIVGLAIGIAAPSILKELANMLGWGTTPDANVNAALTLSAIALRVLNFLLGIAGVISLVMLVVGAIMYLTSAGDEERIDSGKKIFKYSLIGIILIMASLVIVRQIASFFSAG